jgi:hypothetical protein
VSLSFATAAQRRKFLNNPHKQPDMQVCWMERRTVILSSYFPRLA